MMHLHQYFTKAVLVSFVLFSLVQFCLSAYHSNEMINQLMVDMQARYPDMAYMYSIGSSVNGRDLSVLAISSSNASEHVSLRPEVKYVGNIHGNEVVSREILYNFITYLLENYGTNENITLLLDTTRVHIMPTMNPDGFEEADSTDCTGFTGRWNGNGRDLNRGFPDVFDDEWARDFIEPEVDAAMKWFAKQQFVLSANFHGGAVVANYPYDSTPLHIDQFTGYYSKSEDDDTFQHITQTYASAHRSMINNNKCPVPSDRNGITNGAEWYTTRGGMQDYNYVFAGCMEITVELTCCKYPSANELDQHWFDNKDSLLQYLLKAHQMGVKGLVTFHDDMPVSKVEVHVDDRMKVLTTELGEFWKLLLPGEHAIMVYVNGHLAHKSNITVIEGVVLRKDIKLPEAAKIWYAQMQRSGGSSNLMQSSVNLAQSWIYLLMIILLHFYLYGL